MSSEQNIPTKQYKELSISIAEAENGIIVYCRKDSGCEVRSVYYTANNLGEFAKHLIEEYFKQ